MRKPDLCGIYEIVTPRGSRYVGSSTRIHGRWAEHRSHLKRGRHHSRYLQAAYAKYGSALIYRVIEECPIERLVEREQHFIDALGARLNCIRQVNNAWTIPGYRKRWLERTRTPEWKAAARARHRAGCRAFKPVETDSGLKFECMADAARHFGLRVSGIAHLVRTQQRGKLGVRFKAAAAPWIPETTLGERLSEGRRRNGTQRRSEAAKAKMKAAAHGRRPGQHVGRLGNEVTQRGVRGVHLESGAEVFFPSQRDAARTIRPERYRTAGAQICMACRGVKKSAYGYRWEYADAA